MTKKKFVYVDGFPQEEEEAKRLYEKAYADDPFEDCDATLLNSADIEDYAKQVGLIFPFKKGTDGNNLKTASYGAHVGDKVVLWSDEHRTGFISRLKTRVFRNFKGVGQLHAEELISKATFDLTKQSMVEIPPFSLVYIQTQETFFLPLYIAARFNLRINFVHKGLLLGTGPLVDPGFAGKLLIPIHNLTNNTYTISKGDKLIWVEFTKTTLHESWKNDSDKSNLSKYARAEPGDFPKAKRNLEPTKYLTDALLDRNEQHFKYTEIKSGIPSKMQEFQETAESSKAAARSLNTISFFALFGVAAALITFIMHIVGLYGDKHDRWSKTNEEINNLRNEISILKNELKDIDKIETDLDEIESNVDRIEDKVFDQNNDKSSQKKP